MTNRQGRSCFTISAAILIASALFVAACASGSAVKEGQDVTSFASAVEGTKALTGEWTVVELGEKPIADLLPAGYEGRLPMLSIKPDGTVSGFSGVNQFGSELQVDQLTKGRFALGPIAMTRMAAPPEFMSVEAKMTMSLSEPRRFSLKDNVLSLMPAEGRADPLVRFRRETVAASPQAGSH